VKGEGREKRETSQSAQPVSYSTRTPCFVLILGEDAGSVDALLTLRSQEGYRGPDESRSPQSRPSVMVRIGDSGADRQTWAHPRDVDDVEESWDQLEAGL
jgi:hypothetical protein